MKQLVTIISLLTIFLGAQSMSGMAKSKAKKSIQKSEDSSGSSSSSQENSSEEESLSESSTSSEVVPPKKSLELARVHFSPDIRQVLKTIISNEKKGISGAQFRFTLYDVAQVWAHKMKEENFKGKLVLDRGYKKDHPEALRMLHTSGVQLLAVTGDRNHKPSLKPNWWSKPELMHNKFLLFKENAAGRPLLITGSFNCTGKASESNWENIVLIDDEETIAKFKEQLKELLAFKHTKPITAAQLKAIPAQKSYAQRLNGLSNQIPVQSFDFPEVTLAPYKGGRLRTCFSPDIRGLLLSLMAKETSGIIGALYRFTLEDVAQAWADRHKSAGITGLIYIDKEFTDDSMHALEIFHKNGGSLRQVNKPRELESSYKAPSPYNFEEMHHKFMIFKNVGGKQLVVTGSCNFTGAANEINWENMVVLSDSASIQAFVGELRQLNSHAEKLEKLPRFEPKNDSVRKMNGKK